MKRVNISKDVASREKIASATTQTSAHVPVIVEPSNKEDDGKTEESQGGEDNAPAEPDTTPKRGRAAKRDAEKV